MFMFQAIQIELLIVTNQSFLKGINSKTPVTNRC